MKRRLKEWHFGPLLCYRTELFANLRFLWTKLLKFQSQCYKEFEIFRTSELLLSWTITAESSSYCVWHLLCKVVIIDTRSAFQHWRCRAEELSLDLPCIAPTQAVYVSRSLVSPLALEHRKWLFSAGHLRAKKVLGNLPCDVTVGKGHVRLSECLSLFLLSYFSVYQVI